MPLGLEVLTVTNEQKLQIRKLRKENCSYSNIASTLGVTLSAVKGYCQRNGLAGVRAVTEPTPEPSVSCCKNCGKEVIQRPGIKEIKFCSGSCRQAWWNDHLDLVSRKAVYEYTCACCGKPFSAYGNSHRKYCSHSCYIEERYGRRDER